MQNEADNGHQNDGWYEQESSEADVELHPLPQASTWADPEFDTQHKMPNAFGGTDHRVQFFEPWINRRWLERLLHYQQFIFPWLHSASLCCRWPFQQLK